MYSEKVQVLLPSATGSSDWIEKLPCVRMMIWLAVYHQLYNQQVRNSVVNVSLAFATTCSKCAGL